MEPESESYQVVDKMASFKRIKTLENIVKEGLNAEEELSMEDKILAKQIDKSYVVKESVRTQILS